MQEPLRKILKNRAVVCVRDEVVPVINRTFNRRGRGTDAESGSHLGNERVCPGDYHSLTFIGVLVQQHHGEGKVLRLRIRSLDWHVQTPRGGFESFPASQAAIDRGTRRKERGRQSVPNNGRIGAERKSQRIGALPAPCGKMDVSSAWLFPMANDKNLRRTRLGEICSHQQDQKM